jgi:hypothetical protein
MIKKRQTKRDRELCKRTWTPVNLILNNLVLQVKVKAIPLLAWIGPEVFRKLRLPEFLDNRHIKVARLSSLSTGRLYSPGNIPGTYFCYRLSRP